MRFDCLFVVMPCMEVMGFRQLGMMGGFLVVLGLVMFGSFHVVLCCLLVMLSCLFMMFVSCVSHVNAILIASYQLVAIPHMLTL